jgi:Domain of unknown function (DUF4111)
VAREHGLVVVPDSRELIDPIGPEQLRAAVRASLAGHWALQGTDVAWLRPRNYQALAVLSMCRDLYALEHGTLASKPVAAAWASRGLGPPWTAQVERALGWRPDPASTTGPCRRRWRSSPCGRPRRRGGLSGSRGQRRRARVASTAAAP